MNLRFAGKIVLLVVALMLATAPFLLGCGGGQDGGENTMVIGWLGDQTGVSAGAFKEVVWGMDDYFAEMDPIEGINIEMQLYDTRLDYGRIPIGYDWLVSQGMDICMVYSVAAVLGIKGQFAEDQIPALSFTVDPMTRETPWMYGVAPDYNTEGEYLITYLVKDWWETKGMTRPIKIGVFSQPSSATTNAYYGGFDLGIAANPGKCEVTKVTAPMTQTAFVSEVAALQGSDVIIITIPGTPGPLFIKEALQRGYEGRFLSGSASLLGVWTLTQTLLTPQELDGLIVPHSWHVWEDDNDFVAEMAATLESRRPSDADTLKEGTTWQTGWTTAHIIAGVLRSAAEAVGPENVAGPAIRDAIDGLSLQIPTWPVIGLANSGGQNILQPYYRMIEYRAADNQFHAISDWFAVTGS